MTVIGQENRPFTVDATNLINLTGLSLCPLPSIGDGILNRFSNDGEAGIGYRVNGGYGWGWEVE